MHKIEFCGCFRHWKLSPAILSLPLWKSFHHAWWFDLFGQIKGIALPKSIAYSKEGSQLKGKGGNSVNKGKTSCLVVSNEDRVKGQLEKKDKKIFQMTVIAKNAHAESQFQRLKMNKRMEAFIFLTGIKWEKASLCPFT